MRDGEGAREKTRKEAIPHNEEIERDGQKSNHHL